MAKFDAFLFFTKIQISPGISIEASERQITVHASSSVRLKIVFYKPKSTIYFPVFLVKGELVKNTLQTFWVYR